MEDFKTAGLLHSSNDLKNMFMVWCFKVCKYFKSNTPTISSTLPLSNEMKYDEDLATTFKLWETEQNSSEKSIYRVLWKVFRNEYIKSLVPGLLSNAIFISASLEIYVILSYLKNNDYSFGIAILFTVIYGVTIQGSCSLRNLSLFKTYILTAKIKGIFAELIYDKTMKLGINTLSSSSETGKFTNLINSDIETFGGLKILPTLFSIPLILVFSVGFLSYTLGISGIIGILTIILHLPITYLLAKFIAKYRFKSILLADYRLSLISDLIQGIKIIKFYGWESPYLDEIFEARRCEIRKTSSNSWYNVICKTLNLGSTGLVLLVTFSSYTLLGNKIETVSAFTAISVLTLCTSIITSKGIEGIVYLMILKVSFRRFNEFLQSEEKNEILYSKSSIFPIQLENCVFTYKNDEKDMVDEMSLASVLSINLTEKFCLYDLNFKLGKGELLVVLGPTASGKSALLLSLLRELALVEGNLEIQGTIAYTSQFPWLIEGTIRDNILMGLPMDENLYKTVIDVCGLEPDLNYFGSIKDLYNVGEKGMNLSGGQMARVSLARALYMNRDIYVLDDPFSAIDLTLRTQLFESCIEHFLCEKTIVIATHQELFLKKADKILVLDNGRQVFFGVYQDFIKSKSSNAYGVITISKRKKIRKDIPGFFSFGAEDVKEDQPLFEGTRSLTIPWKIYRKYFLLGYKNWFFIVALVLLLFVTQFCNFALTWWFTYWISSPSGHTVENILIFLGIVVVFYLFVVARECAIIFPLIKSSENLHNCGITALANTDLSYFESFPAYRIQNSYSKDILITDSRMPIEYEQLFVNSTSFFSTLIVTCYIFPYQIIVSISVIIYLIFILSYFICVIKDLRKVEFQSRPQILSTLKNTVLGMSSIRCHNLQNHFTEQMKTKSDKTCQLTCHPN